MRPFTYAKPASAAGAVGAIAAAPGARFLAGGTTLYDLMKLDVERPGAIVDVTALPGLSSVDASDPAEITFGALARMADAAEDTTLRRDYPALTEALEKAASQQLRNMATLGGNILQRTRCPYFRGGEPYACNKRVPGSGCAAIGGLDRGHAVLGGSEACIAVYPGDWAVALCAFDAVVDVVGPNGQRSIPFNAFHREPGLTPAVETSLARDELVLRIRVPKTPLGRASTYHKVRDRESYAFALASAAVAVRLEGGTVREARVALGGLATRPWRARSRGGPRRPPAERRNRAGSGRGGVARRPTRTPQRLQDRARHPHGGRRTSHRPNEGLTS